MFIVQKKKMIIIHNIQAYPVASYSWSIYSWLINYYFKKIYTFVFKGMDRNKDTYWQIPVPFVSKLHVPNMIY